MRRWAASLLLILLGLLVPIWDTAPEFGAATAQQVRGVDEGLDVEEFEDWERLATRAEDSIANGQASDAAFDVLRADLVTWRTRFQAELALHETRIDTLEAQIAALGPPPGEGETEAEALVERREELNQQYQTAIAPVRKAEEALTRAESLIRDLDRLVRQRQQQKLLERGPSPLNPANIASGLNNLNSIVRVLVGETTTAYVLSSERKLLRDRLGVIVLLLGVAGILLWIGRTWIYRFASRIAQGDSSHGRRYVLAMLLSLGQVILPGIGLVLIAAALRVSSMFGVKGEALITQLPTIGLAFFTLRWLASQTFPKSDTWKTTLSLGDRERRRGRFYMGSLGVLVAVALLLQDLRQLFVFDDGAVPILAFPIIVLTALCNAGLGRLLIANAANAAKGRDGELDSDTPDERSFFDRVFAGLGRFVVFLAVVGPLLAAIGYLRAGVFLTVAPGLTLALLALINFLQRLNVAMFQAFSPRGRDAADGLWPVVINLLILIASLPFFALIWGGRVTEMEEFWNSLREGVVIGETEISPSIFLAFLAVFLLGYALTRLFQGVLRTSILPRTKLDPGAQSALTSGLGYVGLTIAAMMAVSVAGLDLSSLAIVAGALSVGLGFGLQNVVSNFVSGLILLAERPVSEGDWIEVDGVMGTVRKISVRATTVETFDRTDVVVPNSDLITSQVTNWTRGNLSGRLILPVGVAYGTDTRKVQEILQEIAEEHPLVIVNPPPAVVFQGFGESSLDFEMRVILRDINFGLGARTELNHRIAERFAEEGIEIPFAQRDLWLRNPEALRPTPAPPRPGGFTSTAPITPDSMPEFPSEDT